ncbi:MAG TPA: hypothetical protein VJY62_18170, partial [Bacteroidia bacterium]|nr:hypothetical protein [Bacteroidia bacterium]
MILITGVVIISLFISSKAFSQPANDACSNAITLTVDAACTNGTTVAATLQGSEATAWCGSAPQQSVWYKFVATATVMDVWVDNLKASNTCELASAVWNTGTCLPSGTPTWYKAIGAPVDVWHHLTGLTITNTYLIQICFRTTGGSCGAGGGQTFCVGVYAPSTAAGYTHASTPLEPGVSLGNCVVMTSGGQYYDDGGTASNHGNSYTGLFRVFCPASIGNCMRATLNYVNMTPSNDYLRIVNSSCRNGTTIADVSMGSPGTQYTSTDSSGCLAFRIYSDASTNRAGWNITLAETACSVGPNGTDPNDAARAVPICTTSTYVGNSTGPGLLAETCGTCDLSENHSVWYRFKIATSGTLQFTIDPQDNGDDYDFVLFGPVSDPASLGTQRRCSYAYDASNGNTGLRTSETDSSENSSGNGWVDTMYVRTDEVYYLMLNRTDDDVDPQADGFSLSFASSTCTFNCGYVALPVNLVSFHASVNKEENGVNLEWITASEMNNDYFTIEHSEDAKNFHDVMQIDGAGSNTNTIRYYASDPNPMQGKSYYRLRQTDFNGKISFSQIVKVDVDAKLSQVSIYPNPAKKHFTIDARHITSYDILITDKEGRKMEEMKNLEGKTE